MFDLLPMKRNSYLNFFYIRNMNTIYIRLVLFFILMSFPVLNAQKVKEENDLITKQDQFVLLSQLNNYATQSLAEPSYQQGDNKVFIQQIGVNNKANTIVFSETSTIKLTQKGNDNLIEINEMSKDIDKTITQIGNDNSVIEFSFDPMLSTKTELIQEGNHLIFEKYGSNELSKSLKFKMSGDSKTIIVRSF